MAIDENDPKPNWQGLKNISPIQFQCGWCSNKVSSVLGFTSTANPMRIVICPHCSSPTYFYFDRRTPGVSVGGEVNHLPSNIHQIYTEARDCCSANCYTASVLLSRKLLMNLGVAQGAAEGLKFIQYIEYLSEKGYVPPNGRGWVDHIRNKGNEATHEIAVMSKEDAEDLINFSESLLKFIYEFPSKVPS